MQIAALLVIAGLSARTKLYPGTPKLLSSDEILESKKVFECHMYNKKIVNRDLSTRQRQFYEIVCRDALQVQ